MSRQSNWRHILHLLVYTDCVVFVCTVAYNIYVTRYWKHLCIQLARKWAALRMDSCSHSKSGVWHKTPARYLCYWLRQARVVGRPSQKHAQYTPCTNTLDWRMLPHLDNATFWRGVEIPGMAISCFSVKINVLLSPRLSKAETICIYKM